MNANRTRYFLAILLVAIGVAACERTRIGDITADPGSFRNKEVNVAGEVLQSVGAEIGPFSRGVYEISDGTGNLWVYSESRGVPTRGAHVGVKGRVAQSVTILGRNYGTILQESDRRLEKAAR